jgi:hypothetical protein
MPIGLAARWSPMWTGGGGFVYERPWWRAERRCDDVALVLLAHFERHPDLYSPLGVALPAESYTESRARIDREHPVPKPPLMPGQVWAVLGEDHTWRELTFLGISNGREPCFSNGYMNLHRDAVLVAGPTPWGRDVPWCPSVADIGGTPLAASLGLA